MTPKSEMTIQQFVRTLTKAQLRYALDHFADSMTAESVSWYRTELARRGRRISEVN